ATLAVVSTPAHGTATVDAGKIVYTPADQFSGTDSFTYQVRDNNNVPLGPATVHVVVNRPTANDDFAEASGSLPVTINVLANDTDPDGNDHLSPGSLAIVTGPAHGTAVLSGGAVIYTAAAGFSGTDTFHYTVKDVANATSNTATVTVVVGRPLAVSEVVTTIGTTPVTVTVLPA